MVFTEEQSEGSHLTLQGPILLTSFNFNLSIDK